MTESVDQSSPSSAPGGLTRDAGPIQTLTSTRYLPVTMAVVAAVLFGIGSTMLGVAAARTARPCLSGCDATSTDQLPLALMVVGPGVVTAIAALVSISRARRGHRQAWMCAVFGCVASVLCVMVGSFTVGVV